MAGLSNVYREPYASIRAQEEEFPIVKTRIWIRD
jgi:hypothetical protein